jgi:hypothetical protein
MRHDSTYCLITEELAAGKSSVALTNREASPISEYGKNGLIFGTRKTDNIIYRTFR